MVHRPTDSRLFPIASNKKTLSQLLKSSNAYLASLVAYSTASPPPGSHIMMSVEGSPTGIDDALKRYALGLDERTETMLSLKDARGGSEEYHARTGEPVRLCCVFFFFFFFSCQ
jgi:hypothetical protein